MKPLRSTLGTLVAIVLLAFFGVSVLAYAADAISGKVYVMANRADGNTILVFNRTVEGGLTQIAEAATGGLGSGPGELPTPFPRGIAAGNPLTSQDSLIMTHDGLQIRVAPSANRSMAL